MSKLTVVFYGYCGKRSVFASQADADKAAEQYSREHGYTCEAFECSKHTAKSSGNPTMCWHVRAKTYPAMTREQWEQRAAEKRLIAEQEAASIQARRLQRVAEQEAVRAEAAEREAKILAAAAPKTLEVRHKAVSGKHGGEGNTATVSRVASAGSATENVSAVERRRSASTAKTATLA